MKKVNLELRRLNSENRILSSQNKRQEKEILELRDKLYKACNERNELKKLI
jgi:hypothetical protein